MKMETKKHTIALFQIPAILDVLVHQCSTASNGRAGLLLTVLTIQIP